MDKDNAKPKAKKKKPKKIGRPSKYSERVTDRICHLIATTEMGLHAICDSDKSFPSITVCFWWLTKYESFQNKYALAKKLQAELMVRTILTIADDSSLDTITVTKGESSYDIENKEFVNRSKLRVESRKWLASKLWPKVYGDKIDLTSDGEKIKQSVIVVPNQATKDEINKLS